MERGSPLPFLTGHPSFEVRTQPAINTGPEVTTSLLIEKSDLVRLSFFKAKFTAVSAELQGPSHGCTHLQIGNRLMFYFWIFEFEIRTHSLYTAKYFDEFVFYHRSLRFLKSVGFWFANLEWLTFVRSSSCYWWYSI